MYYVCIAAANSQSQQAASLVSQSMELMNQMGMGSWLSGSNAPADPGLFK